MTETDQMNNSELEALWLSSVKALQDEPEQEPDPHLSTRVKAAVAAERETRRVHRLRFPLVISTAAAAALVALLVVPGLFNRSQDQAALPESARKAAEAELSEIQADQAELMLENDTLVQDDSLAIELLDGKSVRLDREEIMTAFAAPADLPAADMPLPDASSEDVQYEAANNEAEDEAGMAAGAEAAAEPAEEIILNGDDPDSVETFLDTVKEGDRDAVRAFLDAAFADQEAVTVRFE